MKLNPHLVFNGQCAAAFAFYEQCFGGSIVTMLKWGESPMAARTPPGCGDKILHATLTFGDAVLMGSDALPGQYEKPRGFSIMLAIDEAGDAERMFHILAEGGTVTMPIQKTFWAVRFGMLIDRFGVPWEINCEGVTAANRT
jgi:PhnB protein